MLGKGWQCLRNLTHMHADTHASGGKSNLFKFFFFFFYQSGLLTSAS